MKEVGMNQPIEMPGKIRSYKKKLIHMFALA